MVVWWWLSQGCPHVPLAMLSYIYSTGVFLIAHRHLYLSCLAHRYSEAWTLLQMQLVQLQHQACPLPDSTTHWPSNSSLIMNRVILARLQLHVVIDIYVLSFFCLLYTYIYQPFSINRCEPVADGIPPPSQGVFLLWAWEFLPLLP